MKQKIILAFALLVIATLVLGCTSTQSRSADGGQIPQYETQEQTSNATSGLAEGLDTITNDLNAIDNDVT